MLKLEKYCYCCSIWGCWINKNWKNCQIGGQVGFSGHLNIGNNVKINGGSGVFSNLKDNSVVKETLLLMQVCLTIICLF